MWDFGLAPTSAAARPAFRDSSGCGAWLARLPLANVGPAHDRLLGELEEFNASEIAHAERFAVLELLREPAGFLQAEQTKKFTGRAVPLARPEREVFLAVIAMWDVLGRGYLRCLQAIANGSAAASLAALAGQRALWCFAQKLAAHYAAYQELDPEDWRTLHRAYACAESLGVARDEVTHPLGKGRGETSCTETWAQALLLNLANPNELTPRQIALVAQWLERWASKIAIVSAAPDPREDPAPLAVDLAGGSGARRHLAAGENIRYLDVGELARTLRRSIARLREGQSPDALELGEALTPAAAEGLLALLYRQLCEDRQSRQVARRSASATAQVCAGIGAIHYHVTGRLFREPSEGRELTKAERDAIATFGQIASHQEESTARDFVLETWQIRDESLSGLRLERIAPAANLRLHLNQLLGVRPADAKSFLLGVVRWLSVSANLELRVGVRTLPGVPLGVAVRPSGLNARAEHYVPALMLPAVPALQSPDSVVLPAGWYRPKRVIEVFTEQPRALLLSGALDRGSDFDRASFEPA